MVKNFFRRLIALIMDEYDEQQIDASERVLHEVRFDDLSHEEFRMVRLECEARGFNRLRRGYRVERVWDETLHDRRLVITLDLEGLRAVAESSGKWRGTLGPEWCAKDGKWVRVWLSDDPPFAARVGVLREGFIRPVWRVALWREHCHSWPDELTPEWERQPCHLLGEKAESLALAAVFPERIRGEVSHG